MDEEIAKKFNELENRIVALEAAGRSLIAPTLTSEKGISIKEFLLSKNPKSDIQKTRAVAYYLERFSGFISFTSEEIQNGYRSAKEALPLNVSDNIAKNVGRGYFMEAQEKKNGKKAWTLTNTGEKDVVADFKESG